MTNDLPRIADICTAWWRASLAPANPRSAGTRAKLRRAHEPIDALMVSETHDLARRLNDAGHDMRGRPDALAAIAVTLAHIREEGGCVASCFGSCADGSGRPPLSEHRFQKLIEAETAFDLATQLLRNLPLISHRADIGSLGNDIFYWGDRVRTRWSFAYFGG